MQEFVKELFSSAKIYIHDYFTNHSLRCTGGSRLFQAGVDRKFVKEVTGHHSNAVDCYQITSAKQREHLSNVIACLSEENFGEISEKVLNNMQTDSSSCKCNYKYH